MKNPMRRKPPQLVLWTPRELHLMQPGRRAAAERWNRLCLQRRSELQPSGDPSWVRQAYRDFWEGKEEGLDALACKDEGYAPHARSEDV